MTTETDRKRFHLERIIEHISEESSSTKNGSFRPALIPGIVIPEQVQVFSSRDSGAFTENLEKIQPKSGSTSEDDIETEKGDSSEADESAIPMKISPRCDICGLLHFKSYRCLTGYSAPSYLRKAFDDDNQKLRVCRKCLTSKESFVENVAISSLATYSAQISQMKIPLGMTSDRRTKAFEFVVRDLKQLKSGRRSSENGDAYSVDNYRKISPPKSPCQPPRKTLLQRFNVDDPVEKNLFLKELNLYSTDFMKNMTESNDHNMEVDCEIVGGAVNSSDGNSMPNDTATTTSKTSDSSPKASGKAVYHVAAKNVLSTNVTEKKIGEMFDARKGMNYDLVVNTKRAWKPNKKYDDLRKVERPNMKKGGKQRGPKPGKSLLVKVKVDKGEKSDQLEKIRTCGINCAVCDKHVQKSYSCCTFQTAPERFKHLFTPGVQRLKICRKCIPYKKVAKVENQVVKKKTGKVKQKRGRKPKTEKPGAVVKAIRFDGTRDRDVMKCSLPTGTMTSTTAEPFASVMHHNHAQEMLNASSYDRNGMISVNVKNQLENIENVYLMLKRE